MCLTAQYGAHGSHVHGGVMYMLKREGTLSELRNSIMVQCGASSMPLVTASVLQAAKFIKLQGKCTSSRGEKRVPQQPP